MYLGLGIEHILRGPDHLLLLLIVRGRRRLVKTVTAFTVAHSLTLAAATLGVLHLPQPPLEAAIAFSILFLGPEIVLTWRGQSSLTLRHPWVVAFLFGLLHGAGLANGLQQLGLPTPLWLRRLPGYAVGSLGAYWAIERTVAMVAGG